MRRSEMGAEDRVLPATGRHDDDGLRGRPGRRRVRLTRAGRRGRRRPDPCGARHRGELHRHRRRPRRRAGPARRLGRALAGVRWQAVVAAYATPSAPADAEAPIPAAAVVADLEATLTALDTTAVDIFYLHRPTPADLATEALWAALDLARRDGKLRAVGVSVTTPREGLEAVASGRFDVVQAPYSAVSALHVEVFERAAAAGLGVAAMMPRARGLLGGLYRPGHEFGPDDRRAAWPAHYRDEVLRRAAALGFLADESGAAPAQLALAYTLSHPALSVSVAGARLPEHVRENATAPALAPLAAEHLDRIAALQRDRFGA
ncbi:MAG: aldo/keto reductase [Dehalococcoidia bacterium]